MIELTIFVFMPEKMQKHYKCLNLKANAKINIGLKILNKRDDGYHNLETIFYPVNLCDNITLRTRGRKSNNKVEVFMPHSPKLNNKDNICCKAIELFLKEFKIPGFHYFYVYIHKIIPIGGGLAGGSSDAASILKCLYKIFEISGGEQRLKRVALSLGSDVPFFFINKPSQAKSRGEKIKVIDNFNITGDIIVVNPGIHVSTKWAFYEFDKQRKKKNGKNIKPGKDKHNIDGWLSGNKSIITKAYLENDFEKVVFKKYPEIKAIKDKMYELGASFASMSGSGSSVYGIFRNDSNKPRMYFRRMGYSVFSV